MKFFFSITDMKCKCFSDSEAKFLEGSDSGGWGGIGMTVELSCTCGFPVVIGKGKYLGLGNCIILDYIKVALGLALVNVIGVVGGVSKRKCWRIGPNRLKGSIAKGISIMFLVRILPMTLSPMVEVPVVRFFLLLRPSFFRSCFWRCELALADKMLVTSLEVGSKEGQGARLLMVISNPIVVWGHA